MTTPESSTYRLCCRVDAFRAGWPLEAFLSHRFRYHPAAIWKERLHAGAVEINGRVAAFDDVVQRNDEIAYTFQHREPDVDAAYDVLHEDAWLLAVAKSGNLPVHAGGKFIRHTLIAIVRERFGPDVRLAHRLDRETSGVVLLAKSADAARALEREFHAGRVDKRYTAVLRGRADEAFTVDAPIARAETPGPPYFRIVDREAGKASVTRFERRELGTHAETGEPLSLMDVRPLTGRTNQIRVHAAHAGHPVLGDKVYGVAAPDARAFVETGDAGVVSAVAGAPRHLLHCRELAFRHPDGGRDVVVMAPLPPDFGVFRANPGGDLGDGSRYPTR